MKRIACFLLILCVVFGTSLCANAEGVATFVLNTKTETAECGDEFTVTVELSNTSKKGVSAFDCSLAYDSDRLTVKEITPIGNVVGKDFQYSTPQDGVIKFIFCEVVPLPAETTEFLDIKFRVLDSALSGDATVRVTGGSLCDENANDLTGDLFTDVSVAIESENTTAPITTKTESTTEEIFDERPVLDSDSTMQEATEKETISFKGVYEKEEQDSFKIPPVVWVMLAAAFLVVVWFVLSKKLSKK